MVRGSLLVHASHSFPFSTSFRWNFLWGNMSRWLLMTEEFLLRTLSKMTIVSESSACIESSVLRIASKRARKYNLDQFSVLDARKNMI